MPAGTNIRYMKISGYRPAYIFYKQTAKPKHAKYYTEYFCGGEVVIQLIFSSDKEFMSTIIQNCVVKWYHIYLLHPAIDITETTISQN